MAKKVVGVLGLGIFGSTIAKELGENGYDVIAVDTNITDVDRIEPFVVQAVQGDMRDLELLQSIGFESCDIAVIGTGSNLEASVMAIMNCRKLGIDYIIAKAKNKTYREILLEIGADEVIRPEKEAGDKLARNLMRNHIVDLIKLDESNSLIELTPPQKWLGKTLAQLDLRKKYELNVIGIRKDKLSTTEFFIDPDMEIATDMILVAVGNTEKFEHLDYTNRLD
ncbi:potassium channel family protein [Atopococcus tabaci]|uniref:potassium channel family protein n=1 Tax=Atopococcus tabaci TaxID=269774 RepID=UPI00040DFED1|nr:TrkA family potassium uptake protein [Atopococcus tabaci]